MTFDGDEAGSNVIDLKNPATALVPATLQEAEADDALVAEACQKVKEVVIEAISGGMDTIGDFLFDKFFDNAIDRVRKKQPVKDKSFLKLIERLQETEADTPSRSWLYNAVNIAADKAYFEGEKLAAYGKLSVTQRVFIARINDLDKKKAVIKETLDKNYSVRELKVRIGEMIKRRETLKLEDLNRPETKILLLKKTPARLEAIVEKLKTGLRALEQEESDIQVKKAVYKMAKENIKEILKKKASEQRPKKVKENKAEPSKT
jgi:hypothetical protein